MRSRQNRRRRALRVSRVLKVVAGTGGPYQVRSGDLSHRRSASGAAAVRPWVVMDRATTVCLGRDLMGRAATFSWKGADEEGGGYRPLRLFAPDGAGQGAFGQGQLTPGRKPRQAMRQRFRVASMRPHGRLYPPGRVNLRLWKGLTGTICASGSDAEFSGAAFRGNTAGFGGFSTRPAVTGMSGDVLRTAEQSRA